MGKYLDESGFSLWAEVVYTWGKKGKQKRIEQSRKKGKRLSICGLYEVGKSFEYGLVLKSFTSENYIKLIDWQAEKAAKRFEKTGQITVVVHSARFNSYKPPHTHNNIKNGQNRNYIYFSVLRYLLC